MTKPIEGWVKVEDENPDRPVVWSIERGGFPTVKGRFVSVELDLPTDGKYRPVKITFADTTAHDLINDYVDDGESIFKQMEKMHSYVESLAPELNGYIEPGDAQKIQNALKKERERIWNLLSIYKYQALFYETIDVPAKDAREIIFGEEK